MFTGLSRVLGTVRFMRRLTEGLALCLVLVGITAGPAGAFTAKGVGTADCVPVRNIGFMGACVTRPTTLSAPEGSPVAGAQGVDISVWNGPSVDFVALKRAGVRYVVIKADQACGRDARFVENVQRARAAGLYVESYVFIQPGLIAPAPEMACLAADDRLVGVTRLTLPDTIDAESFNGLGRGAICSWLAIASTDLRADTGRQVVTYSSPGLWPGCGTADTLLYEADWGVSFPPRMGFWGSPPVDWQYFAPQTATGSLSGMDRDKAFGLLAYAYKPPKPKPKPKPKPNVHLAALVKRRDRVRALEAKHDCRAHPKGYGACRVWIPEGQRLDRQIKQAEAK